MYNRYVIASFQSKALEQLYRGNPRLIEAKLRRKVENILLSLTAAKDIEGMDLPGYRLHELKRANAGVWAVTVNQNWRITFRFENGHAHDVDFVDYH
jgi:proteic killer suppression protein